MYAVIQTGGKQYRVEEGGRLDVERLAADEGSAVEFDRVLLVCDGEQTRVGTPFVDGSAVTATVEDHRRGRKIEVVKFRRRKHHRKQMGHRQELTRVRITGIRLAT